MHLLAALAVVVGVALWSARRAARFAGRGRSDLDWLPVELVDAELAWSEKTFRAMRPVPATVRIDRAYRTRGDVLTLVEFKRRALARAHLSDVVELSFQRYVMQRFGHIVRRRAYVVVLLPDGTRRPLAVELEAEQQVEHRAGRLLAIKAGDALPSGAVHQSICRNCGHRDVCPRRSE